MKTLQRKLPDESALAGCRACGLVFSGLTAFDHHRNKGKGQERECQAPEAVGLVLHPTRNYWRFPQPEEAPEHWNRSTVKRKRVLG